MKTNFALCLLTAGTAGLCVATLIIELTLVSAPRAWIILSNGAMIFVNLALFWLNFSMWRARNR